MPPHDFLKHLALSDKNLLPETYGAPPGSVGYYETLIMLYF